MQPLQGLALCFLLPGSSLCSQRLLTAHWESRCHQCGAWCRPGLQLLPHPVRLLPAFGQHPPRCSQDSGLRPTERLEGGRRRWSRATVAGKEGTWVDLEQAEPQQAFWGKGLLVRWQALGRRWNNEVERAGWGTALRKHLGSLGDGVPSRESPELYTYFSLGLVEDWGRRRAEIGFLACWLTRTFRLIQTSLALFFDFYLVEILGS